MYNYSNLTAEERIEMLEDAKDKLWTAIELIQEALYETEHQRHAEAYIIPHLKGWIEDTKYDIGIDGYIEYLLNAE